MENYANAGAAVLSQEQSGLTDTLIVSAINESPKSVLSSVMPIGTVTTPTTQWIEPLYSADKLEMLSTPIDVFKFDSHNPLKLSANAVEDIRKQYGQETFVKTISNWVTYYKNKKQTQAFLDILNSPIITNTTPYSSVPSLVGSSTNDDVYEVRSRILECIVGLAREHQLGTTHFSVVAPYEFAYAESEIALLAEGKIHTMYQQGIDKVYVFPSGFETLGRAGFTLFEYTNDVQRAVDFDTGDEVFFYYNRFALCVNPIHSKVPVIRVLDIE